MNPEDQSEASPDVPDDVPDDVPGDVPAGRPDLPPGRPRWVFRGDDAALDGLTAAIATDPLAPFPWPIAPSGPSMDVGDGVLLWRSGREGGVVAACTVLDEPVASVAGGGEPRVTVDVRIDRAFGRPLAPADLLDDASLRPLAFLDLHDATELRLTAVQQDAFAAAVAARDGAGAGSASDDADEDEVVEVPVPRRLLPVVSELLARLGAHEPPPRPSGARQDAVHARTTAPAAPTDVQLHQAEQAALAHGTDPFTVDQVAATWRTGVGTARSRVERLLEVGLVVRAGTLRGDGVDGRPTRGRPPVLYRLTTAA